MYKNKAWNIFIAFTMIVTSLFFFKSQPASAISSQGTIAYIRPNDATGDEIWLIDPDGKNNHKIWSTERSGYPEIDEITQLTWNPDATELAFASKHEAECSFYDSDIYAIYPDGSGYRRVTAPPACGQDAGLPTGTVVLTIDNYTDFEGPYTVYFEGSSGFYTDIIPVYGSKTFIFDDVADFGSQIQWAVASVGMVRYHSFSGNADVIAGQTVEVTLDLYAESTEWDWNWPTYRSDGSKIAYVFGSQTPYFIGADQDIPGDIGEKLFQTDVANIPPYIKYLAYGPAGTHANEVLYSAYSYALSSPTIFLGEENDTSAGTPILAVDPGYAGITVLGLTWLPDGSGFLYSVTEGYGQKGNMYEYNFSTGESIPITNYTSGYVRRMSVSADGSQVVYERQELGEWTDLNPSIDLWIMNLNGGGQALLVENAKGPSWSYQTPSVPTPPTQPSPTQPAPTQPAPIDLSNAVFLPFINR